MDTELEKTLWRMLYKSQVALAKRELDDMNQATGDEDWPAGQAWHELAASSHAIFFRKARAQCGIDDAEYLNILRSDLDAQIIAYEELEAAENASNRG